MILLPLPPSAYGFRYKKGSLTSILLCLFFYVYICTYAYPFKMVPTDLIRRSSGSFGANILSMSTRDTDDILGDFELYGDVDDDDNNDDVEDEVENIAYDDLLKHWEKGGRSASEFDQEEALTLYLGSGAGFGNKMKQPAIVSLAESFEKLIKKEPLTPQPASAFNISVGIDLGTSNSAISYISEGLPRIVSIDGSNTIPSAVCYCEDGSILVGKSALKR